MHRDILLLLFPLMCCVSTQNLESSLDVKIQWSQLEFDYASEAVRQRDIDSGSFDVGKIIPIGSDVFYPGGGSEPKIFVTVPRFQPGVPATLGTVSNKTYKGNLVITPYPSWSWNEHPESCKTDRLVSVFRIEVDKPCNRLWVLDTGNISLEHSCPPQILAFDLTTNKLISRYEIPESQYVSSSLFITPVVDVRDTCDDVFVYVADVQYFTLLIYDVAAKTSWTITDKTFFPNPDFGTFKIEGTQFENMDGLFSLSLSPYRRGRDRKLYYHTLAGVTENWVSTSTLRNKKLFKESFLSHPEIFHEYKRHRYTQSAAAAIDSHGVMFFSLLSDNSIACWDTAKDYLEPGSSFYVARNSKTLQFPSSMKILRNRESKEEMWVMTIRFQRWAAGTLDPSEVNFRISTGEIAKLTAGTKCSVWKPHS